MAAGGDQRRDQELFDLSTAFKTLLEEEAAELKALSQQSKDARAPVTLDQQSVGRLSRMDAIQQQSMDLAREERRQVRIKVIEAALKRIADDDYGYCLVCGDDIAYERLKADPAVTKCIDCTS